MRLIETRLIKLHPQHVSNQSFVSKLVRELSRIVLNYQDHFSQEYKES